MQGIGQPQQQQQLQAVLGKQLTVSSTSRCSLSLL
jgi:hypothetical protein